MLTAAGLALGAVLRPGRAVEMFALAGVMYLPAWLSVGLLVAVGAYARRVSVDPFDEAAYLQAVAAPAQVRSVRAAWGDCSCRERSWTRSRPRDPCSRIWSADGRGCSGLGCGPS